MGIKKTYEYKLTVGTKGSFLDFNREFSDKKPNVFQIRNKGVNDVYVSKNSNVSATEYDINIIAGGTRVFIVTEQFVSRLNFYSASSNNIVVLASYSDDVRAQDLDQTQQSIILNYTSPPVVVIDDSTPVDIAVTGNVVIDDSTPVDVAVTGNVVVDDSTPIAVETQLNKDVLNDNLVVIDNNHSAIHNEEGYNVCDLNDSVANNGVLLYQLKMGATKFIHFQNSKIWTSGGKAKIEIIENPTITDGSTELTPINHKRNSVLSSDVTVYTDPTAISGGTTVFEDYFGGGDKVSGNLKDFLNEFVFVQSTDYLIRITNLDGGVQDFSTVLFWYEEEA